MCASLASATPPSSDGRKPLRVLIVGPYPVADAPVGGVESAVSGLVAGLSRRDDVAAVHVADFRASAAERTDESLQSKVTVHRLPAQRRLRLLNRALTDRHRLKALVTELDPDIVHGQGIGLAGYVASTSGRPTVTTVHGITVQEMVKRARGVADGFRVRALDRIAALAIGNSDAVISISLYDQVEIARYRPRLNPVIPNAVAPLCGSPTDAMSREVLFAGVLIPRKKVVETIDTVAAVAKVVEGARLRVAGPSSDTRYREAVDAALDRAGGCAEYIGALDRAELAMAMTRAGVLVLFAEQETLPVVVAEAMSCGRVVVAANVGGLGEMIEDGVDGVLVQSGDTLALERALRKVLSDDELRVAIGRRAAASGRRYDPEDVAGRTVEVYRKVLGW